MISSTTLSSREFDQDTSRAKKLAADGPVFITDRGKPSYVLLTIAHYRQLVGSRGTIGACRRKYKLKELISQCDLTAAPPADLGLWDTGLAVGQEVL